MQFRIIPRLEYKGRQPLAVASSTITWPESSRGIER